MPLIAYVCRVYYVFMMIPCSAGNIYINYFLGQLAWIFIENTYVELFFSSQYVRTYIHTQLCMSFYSNLISLLLAANIDDDGRDCTVDLSCHNWPPRTICGKLCCRRWSPWTKYDCHGWSALPQVVPHQQADSKWIKSWLEYINMDMQNEVTVENAMHVCCNND